MKIVEVDKKNKNIKVAIPLTEQTGKARVKNRDIWYAYGVEDICFAGVGRETVFAGKDQGIGGDDRDSVAAYAWTKFCCCGGADATGR